MLSERILLYSTVVILLAAIPHLCSARNVVDSCTSSCGIIPNISYPFRLNTSRKRCGRPNSFYKLACENNLTILRTRDVKYHVQAIDYNNQTIRLKDGSVDKDDCSSIPTHSLIIRYISSDNNLISLIFIKCADPINDPLYVDTSTCRNGTYNSSYSLVDSQRGYSYFKIGKTSAAELGDSCRIQMMTLTSWPRLTELHNVSYLNILESLAYGFEIGWLDSSLYCMNSHGDSAPCFDYSNHLLDVLYTVLFRLRYVLLKVPYYYYIVEIISFPINFIAYSGSTLATIPVVLLQVLVALIVLYRAALFIFGTPCVIAFLIYKWRKRHLSMYNGIEEFLQNQANLMPIRYSYSNIKKITSGFKHKLGEGGFGSVYKGKLRSGRLVAIKMLNNSKGDGIDFINEVGTIGRIHHVNVVKLLGFCVEGSHRALVYEFMANGSLEKFVFSQEDNKVLSIEKIYEISLGVACGIEYLHRGCDMQILHFDIKPHNILLDENFIPKLSDFGLAKLYPTNSNSVSLTAARGTLGYMAPELLYKNIGGVSYKADVYSFGMLLMEMAGKRKNLNAFAEHTSQIYFPTWAYDRFNEGKDIELDDDATGDEKNITKKMVMVALWCIQLKPTDRPPMHKVIEILERDVRDINLPPRPALSLLDQK